MKILKKSVGKKASANLVVDATSSTQHNNSLDNNKQSTNKNIGGLGGCPRTPTTSGNQPILIENSEKEWTEVRVGRRKKKGGK